jgi:hypothetical protein
MNKIKKIKIIYIALFLSIFFYGCGPKLEPLPIARTFESSEKAQDSLKKLELIIIPVSGTGSMAPLIPIHPLGSKIIVAYAGLDKMPYSELKSGYVVIYSRYGKKIIHRLGEQDDRGFIAFGINNHDKDRSEDGGIGFVTPYNYIGHVSNIALFPINNK